MNIKKIRLSVYFLLIGCLACVKQQDFELPPNSCQDTLETNINLEELYNMANQMPQEYLKDDYLEAYVISNDQEGNIFKTVYFQNLEGSLGFSIVIDQTDLYTYYNPGDRVVIKLLNLFYAIDNGALKLGVFTLDNFNNESIGRLANPDFLDHVKKSCTWLEETELVNRLSLDQINDEYLNTLIEVEGVQFTEAALGQKYYESSNDNAGATDHLIQDASRSTMIFRTSAFADYADTKVPEGNGTIRGLLSKFKENYQLIARSQSDIKLNLPRKRFGFTDSIQGEKLTIAQLRALYLGADLSIAQEGFIEAIVSLSGYDNTNISNKRAFVQDQTAAIALAFNNPSTVAKAYKLKINIKDNILSKSDGLLVLSIDQEQDVQFLEESQDPLDPKALDLSQLISGQFESQLVKLDSVQFEQEIGIYEGQQILTNCRDLIPIITRNEAAFSQLRYPDKNGHLIAIASNNGAPFLILREVNDAAGLTQERCQVNQEPYSNIFFSELADPNNAPSARFIEIYNAGTRPVNLNGWSIKRYTNANTNSTASIDLSGRFIQAGQAFVIAAQGAGFESAFGFAPDMVAGIGSPADSNGDDNLELIGPDGSLIDVFGIVGEDGSGTDHEFEDGRALRNNDILQASSEYLFEQWQIWNDTGAAGTINAPQDAPGAFSPGLR